MVMLCVLTWPQAPNWLSKLGVVKKELVDEADRARPDVPELAAGYVYLQVCAGMGGAVCAARRPGQIGELSCRLWLCGQHAAVLCISWWSAVLGVQRCAGCWCWFTLAALPQQA